MSNYTCFNEAAALLPRKSSDSGAAWRQGLVMLQGGRGITAAEERTALERRVHEELGLQGGRGITAAEEQLWRHRHFVHYCCFNEAAALLPRKRTGRP